MFTDTKITVTLSSRLFADEVTKLQERLGSILPLKDPHGAQNIQSVGLGSVCGRDTVPDYVIMYNYLSKCTLAILDEVTHDALVFSKIDPTQTYQIKNVYRPFFQWDGHSQLVVMPPIFNLADSTVYLESNGTDIVFPMVVPLDIGQDVLQKLLMYNIYSRVMAQNPDINQQEVLLHTSHITHLGRTYTLDLDHQNPMTSLNVLDNLGIYLAILSALIPRGCLRLVTSLMRHNEHELLGVFGDIIPQEVANIDLGDLSIGDDIVRMGAMMTYLQTLGTIFNLGPRFFISTYSSETLAATCWYTIQ